MKLKTKKKNRKINATKSWFFEKVNKIDKPLARLIKERRRTQTKSGMKEGKLQQTLRKYKGSYKNTMEKYIAPNFITRGNGPVLRKKNTAFLN